MSDLLKRSISSMHRLQSLAEAQLSRRFSTDLDPVAETLEQNLEQRMFSFTRGLVIDNRDPAKLGRVKVYIPKLHTWQFEQNDFDTPERDFEWAMPISMFGSLDDHGSVFTPMPGSVVACLAENGDPNSIYYFGVCHPLKRGEKNDQRPDLEIRRWENRRDDTHLQGGDDHLMPPWNNESYSGPDDFSRNSDDGSDDLFQPHIYGIKTPEKHMIKFVDGKFEDSLKGKAVVMQSSLGNIIFMKDDDLNTSDDYYSNQFFDDSIEQYPDGWGRFGGRQPFNQHKVWLPQSGVHIMSFGGAFIMIDDCLHRSDERENAKNQWTRDFDPDEGQGFNDAMIHINSLSDHMITLNDDEVQNSGTRTNKNGIFIESAKRNRMFFCDDESGEAGNRPTFTWTGNRESPQVTIDASATADHPSWGGNATESTGENRTVTETKVTRPQAGRGIIIQSSSNNLLVMDDGNGRDVGSDKHKKNMNNPRAASGSTQGGYVMLKSAYGQFLHLNDNGNQTGPEKNYILLKQPNGNFLRMEEVLDNKLVHLQCVGDFQRIVGANSSHNITGNERVVIGEEHTMTVGANSAVDVSDDASLTATNISEQASQGISMTAGTDISADAQTNITMMTPGVTTLMDAAGTMQVTAQIVTVIQSPITTIGPLGAPQTGVVTQANICAFTGLPHPDASKTVFAAT